MMIGRRTFLLSASASMLVACTPQVGPSIQSAEAGTPFNTLRDYTGEPYDVRQINRSRIDQAFLPTLVASPYSEPAGTIVIETSARQLYLIEPQGMARRYGIAVGDAGYAWSGRALVGRKVIWPAWYPTSSMRAASQLPARVAPGAHNPLGARALYLFKDGRDTLYRIHGTSEPWTIGTRASSGCIRMFNEDVIDLYDRVTVGATVIVK